MLGQVWASSRHMRTPVGPVSPVAPVSPVGPVTPVSPVQNMHFLSSFHAFFADARCVYRQAAR